MSDAPLVLVVPSFKRPEAAAEVGRYYSQHFDHRVLIASGCRYATVDPHWSQTFNSWSVRLGIGRAVNMGMSLAVRNYKASDMPIYVVHDDDCVVAPSSAERAADFVRRGVADVVGVPSSLGEKRRMEAPREAPIEGADDDETAFWERGTPSKILIVASRVVDKIGHFDPLFTQRAHTDYMIRAACAGFRIGVVRTAAHVFDLPAAEGPGGLSLYKVEGHDDLKKAHERLRTLYPWIRIDRLGRCTWRPMLRELSDATKAAAARYVAADLTLTEVGDD